MSTQLFFLEFYSQRVDIWICSLRRDHSALLDRAIDAYDHGTEIDEDLKAYRKKQRAKMSEVQVGHNRFRLVTPQKLKGLTVRNS